MNSHRQSIESGEAPRNARRMVLSWKFILPVAIVAVAVGVWILTPSRPLLPEKVGGLSLVHVFEGEQANKIIDRMHDKVVTPATNVIGVYGGPANAMIYLSIYPSGREAAGAYKKMADMIQPGNHLFTSYRLVRMEDMDVAFCVGQGQEHYFFHLDKRLYWLAVDASVSATVAEEFLRKIR